MTNNYNEIDQQQSLNHVKKETPIAAQAIQSLAQFAMKNTVLDVKTKALLTLIVAIHSQQSDCIVYHIKNAIEQKVSLEEVQELVTLSTYMGGGPGMMAAEKALSLFEESMNKKDY